MAMNKQEEEERLTYDIDTISANIRKKYHALRQGLHENTENFRQNYKPILEPLEAISRQLTNDITPQVKREAIIPSTNESDAPSEQYAFHFNDPVKSNTMKQHDVASLADKYMRLCESDECKRITDRLYGVRYRAGKWMIGDSDVEIDNTDSISVKGKVYKGTPGLYELLFMKLPKNYNEDDLMQYKSILLATNAHRQKYKNNTRINGNSGVKYKLVISKLFPQKKRTGSGYMKMMNTSIDYVHWDDPNELVNRLRMLTASQSSGHTGHANEIVSIVEELREAGIIV